MVSKKVVLIFAFIVFALTLFASYSYFSNNSVNTAAYKKPVVDENGVIVDNDPKTEECPMNGQMYSKKQEAKWEGRRPLGIMVENSTDARPQSGLSSSDIIYEAVAEGGITRFLNIFYCNDAKFIGPVRSARMYFLQILQEYGDHPLYGHVGGANTPGKANAIGEIRDLGWSGYNDMDQFNVPFPNYWRDYDRLPNRATEHTVYTNSTKLWDYAKSNRKLTNVDEDGNKWDEDFTKWEFKDDSKDSARGTTNKISFEFWSSKVASYASSYAVTWNYDKAGNVYNRVNGGEAHVDKNTGKQLQAKNVVVQFADESPANDGYPGGHLLYGVIGEGDALIFQDGKVIKGTWSKKDEVSRTKFMDEDGNELKFVRGKIWVEIVPTGNEVAY